MHFTYKQKLFNEYHTKVEIVIKNFYMNLSKKKLFIAGTEKLCGCWV